MPIFFYRKKTVHYYCSALYTVSPKITGYHGTYPENVESILHNNFFESKDHNIWLGDGVYFFIDGIGIEHPKEYARQFAIDQCYDATAKKHSRSGIVVFEAIIKINDDKFLDLTSPMGLQLFNQFREHIISKIAASGKKPIGQYKDTDVFGMMREALGIEFVKANVYIKFALQRIGRFNSTVPNVTILTVNNPTKNIQKPSLKVVITEDIV